MTSGFRASGHAEYGGKRPGLWQRADIFALSMESDFDGAVTMNLLIVTFAASVPLLNRVKLVEAG
jgi:hypothetical protein